MADDQNDELASRIGVAVVSVDYRLALANPISALVDNCEAAAQWTIDHALEEFGTRRIVIKGFSAGAHLAAATLLRLRYRELRLGVTMNILYRASSDQLNAGVASLQT